MVPRFADGMGTCTRLKSAPHHEPRAAVRVNVPQTRQAANPQPNDIVGGYAGAFRQHVTTTCFIQGAE